MRNGEGGLDAASQRLMQAVERLEERLRSRAPDDGASAGADSGERDRLTLQLGEARERERALEAAAAEASAALGRAAEQIRTAIEEDEEA